MNARASSRASRVEISSLRCETSHMLSTTSAGSASMASRNRKAFAAPDSAGERAKVEASSAVNLRSASRSSRTCRQRVRIELSGALPSGGIYPTHFSLHALGVEANLPRV